MCVYMHSLVCNVTCFYIKICMSRCFEKTENAQFEQNVEYVFLNEYELELN
jgi:hypothetical protein